MRFAVLEMMAGNISYPIGHTIWPTLFRTDLRFDRLPAFTPAPAPAPSPLLSLPNGDKAFSSYFLLLFWSKIFSIP